MDKKNNNSNNGNGEKFRKMLFNEVSLIVAICGVVIGILLFFTKPSTENQQSIALIEQRLDVIENNHLTHLQNGLSEIKDDCNEMDDKINELDKKIERILTILEK